MKRSTPTLVFTVVTGCFFAVSSSAAPSAISAFTSSGDGTGDVWGILDSITVGSTTYNTLNSGYIQDSDVIYSETIKTNGSFPTGPSAGMMGNNLDTGTTDSLSLLVQFGQTVIDSDLFYLFDASNGDNSMSIRAIDAFDQYVGSSFAINNITSIGGGLIAGRNWEGNTSGALGALQTNAVTWSLSDMSLNSASGVTGFILTSSDVDTVAVGLASVPEPRAFALIAGGWGLLVVMLRGRQYQL